MKLNYLAIVILAIGFLGTVANAGDFATNRAGAFGAGLAVGQPMGVTGKFWLSNITAVDAMMGYHIDDNFDAHADFLVHDAPFKELPNGDAIVYVGMGGRVLGGDDTQFGLRFPIGISHLFYPNNIEVFAELAPVVRLNGIHASVDGLVGVRLYNF